MRALAPAVGSRGSLGKQCVIENDIRCMRRDNSAPEDAGWIGSISKSTERADMALASRTLLSSSAIVTVVSRGARRASSRPACPLVAAWCTAPSRITKSTRAVAVMWSARLVAWRRCLRTRSS